MYNKEEVIKNNLNEYDYVKMYYLKGYSLIDIVDKIRNENKVKIGRTYAQLIINDIKGVNEYYNEHSINKVKLRNEKIKQTYIKKYSIKNDENLVNEIIKKELIEQCYILGYLNDKIIEFLDYKYNIQISNYRLIKIINELRKNDEIVRKRRIAINFKIKNGLNNYFRKRLIERLKKN